VEIVSLLPGKIAQRSDGKSPLDRGVTESCTRAEQITRDARTMLDRLARSNPGIIVSDLPNGEDGVDPADLYRIENDIARRVGGSD